MIKRLLQKTIEESIRASAKSILILGPRQTGKSTLSQALKPALEINLARESEFRNHSNDPELIERIVAPLKKNSLISIDEIQRVPDMLNTIQALIDQKKDRLFVLTGSSARKLKRASVNMLPGRIFRHNLFPLTIAELGKNFSLETALAKGLLPEIYLSDSGLEILENYTNIYLKEEILAEALVRNYASFGHFLELAAHMSWKELNYSQLASDSEIPKETIRRYVEILEDTLLIHRIPGFTNVSSNRKAIQKEKILFFDIGVRNAIIGTHKNKHSPAEWGHLFEHLIVLELIALNSYLKKQWKLSYYRDSKQLEVDLLIEADECLYAIEIKSGSVYKKEWKKNLDTFQEVYLEKKRSKNEKLKKIIVYTGEHEQLDKDVRIVPFKNLIKTVS